MLKVFTNLKDRVNMYLKKCLLIIFYVNYTPPTGQVLKCLMTLTLGMKLLWIY